ncbi:MAG TPA: glycosyltransferase [Verrucomicrobiae bacterium]|nr:glycosyltransferase [Verrucomicrobiae bacterium]
MADADKTVTRVLLVCSGVGIMNRGIESFFREAFDGLKHSAGLELLLLKGTGANSDDERVLRCLSRTGSLAHLLGVLARRNSYVLEQWSSVFSVSAHIRRFCPQVIFYSDANLGFLLFRLRRWIGIPYCLLFSNGGPVHPPFIRTDRVHQVAPCYYHEALSAGEPAAKHFLMPYGINLAPPPKLSTEARDALRRQLRLPLDRKVILSVGWIGRAHKRMHYVIEEVARLPRPRPFLQLLGAMDSSSGEILQLASGLLGPDGFSAKSVPYAGVFEYFQTANCFVLASLTEGFGRVYLEALMCGLPAIAHNNPVTQYVLGRHGILADLTQPGALAHSLKVELGKEFKPFEAYSRWQSVRDRFSWPVLAPGYHAMFESCASSPSSKSFPAALSPCRHEIERRLSP